MTNNKFIIDAVKGEPNSLTAIAFHTGELLERERIIKLLHANHKTLLGYLVDKQDDRPTRLEDVIDLIKGNNSE